MTSNHRVLTWGAIAMAMLAGNHGDVTRQAIEDSWTAVAPGKSREYRGRPSGVARSKRIARKRKNIRARAAK